MSSHDESTEEAWAAGQNGERLDVGEAWMVLSRHISKVTTCSHGDAS
jgi:hypothetical protein